MKVKIGEIKAAGLNHYIDSQGRNIIADKKKRIGYVVEKENEKQYLVYSNRYILAFVAAFFAGTMTQWWVGIIIGVAIAVYLEITYRKNFLNTLAAVTDIDFPKNKGMKQNMIDQNDPAKCILLSVMSFAIPVVSALYMNEMYPGFRISLEGRSLEEKLLLVLLPVMSVAAVYLGICGIAAYREVKAAQNQ